MKKVISMLLIFMCIGVFSIMIYADREEYPHPYSSAPTVNQVIGDNSAETLKGTSVRDQIWGLGGNDIMYGYGGTDDLMGDIGRDILYGGKDVDHLFGDLGNDILYGGSGADDLHGGNNDDKLYPGPGDDYIYPESGSDNVYISHFEGKNSIYLDSGNDTINIQNIGGGDSIGVTTTYIYPYHGNKEASGTKTLKINTPQKYVFTAGGPSGDSYIKTFRVYNGPWKDSSSTQYHFVKIMDYDPSDPWISVEYN